MKLLLAASLYVAGLLGWHPSLPYLPLQSSVGPGHSAPLLRRGMELARCLQAGRSSCYADLRLPRDANAGNARAVRCVRRGR